MPLTVLLASTAVALSVPLLWWSIASTRTGDRASVAANLSGGGLLDLRQAALRRSATERAVRPTIAALAERARRLTPNGMIDALDRRIRLAGSPAAWPLERVLASKLLLGVAGLLLGVLELSVHRTGTWLLFAIGVTALGYFAPDLLLRARAEKRQDEIRGKLPDTLDQMTICVEAGLGFESAMARSAKSGTGVLSDEVTRTLQEVQIGVPRSQALRNLMNRTDVADLRHFVMAVLQAESYGVPIAQVLRVQAAELRLKRRQRAEEKAMKIPIKVLFPLVFCIFPTLFIVLLGPAALSIIQTL